jgi:hypothetical protein
LTTVDEIRKEVQDSTRLSDYEAVDVLWVALVKAANRQAGKNEHQRMMELVRTLSDDALIAILNSGDTNRLLDLDPSLETVLSDRHEALYPDKTGELIRHIRECRNGEPKAGMLSLGEIIKRIRNKRAHGFKSRNSPRDAEILGATRAILFGLLNAVLK